ncbi:alpha/beta fold hydrolase [Pseudanabaena sp. FACHB-2040]|uniref:alpha/beta fold hydrolase n=1 Tax=Pseudanabaena sp. FACHB-2040 TaxID=2692859 RepID=UPI001687BD91|nr:alpha/beta fold hydrolase [Pseudanabaena sp. FACHB-2040]MBD2258658.1 alpha/beta fold hydrolase [Pseudanabaena sp. FACHB-2040]
MVIAEQRIKVGKLTWFYREAEPVGTSDRLPVLLLHGLVAQSYSWRKVMPALAEQGFRAIAPDWIGHGFSDKPDRRDFSYTAEAFVEALAEFVEALELARFHLVVQGFLGSVGLLYALRYPDRVERLAILNAPISPEAKLPWKIKQFGIPLVGDMLTQDPILVDRTLEGGGPYQVDDADLDVYRRPFLKSSDVGRALLATVQGLNLAKVTPEIAAGLPQRTHPTLLLWGLDDPWLPLSLAEACFETLQDGDLVKLDQVGHYAQEDWAEKVAEAISPFLRKMAV